MSIFFLSMIGLPITLLVVNRLRLDLPPVRTNVAVPLKKERDNDFEVAHAA